MAREMQSSIFTEHEKHLKLHYWLGFISHERPFILVTSVITLYVHHPPYSKDKKRGGGGGCARVKRQLGKQSESKRTLRVLI